MAVNRKLTGILKGRVIKAGRASPTELAILFEDGSTLKAKISETIILQMPEGARIRGLHEQNADFVIECDDDKVLELNLAHPGSSVEVLGGKNQVEYLG
ncbi:MAG: hypothetical protein WB586_15435 [Chthoniobacterales bacterium]